MKRMFVLQESGHHGQLKPCGILRPQTLKKMPKLGEREKRRAPTDLQKQVTASISDTLRMMEQHGSALPVVRRPSLIARISAHIFSSESFLEHVPTKGGDSGGVVAGGGGGVVCGRGGGKVCGGGGGGEIVGDGPGQLKPCGILRPQTLKKLPKFGERERGRAPTDLQKQVTASTSETSRTMEQHGSALPVVRTPPLIARISAHIFSSVSFLEHMPTRGGDSVGVVAGGGGVIVCGGDNGGGKVFGGSGGGEIVGDGPGQLKPCGILRPQTLKKLPKFGERERGRAPTDLQKQVTASTSETSRTMEQHGSALPVVTTLPLIARISAHIFSSESFLEHVPTKGGDSGGLVAGGGGGVVCGGGGGGGEIVGDGPGQLNPCGILRPQTLKMLPKFGERERGRAPTDLQKQVTASTSETSRTMEQHGSALPVVRTPLLIARISAHIFSSVSFLEHMPPGGGGGGGVIAGGDNGGGKVFGGSGGGVVASGGGGVVCGGGGGWSLGGGAG
ncbi:hypothetical protein ISN45_Aa07g019330 [Arabidopsis thaliana x Arabidopsis arenosa]|uniref:Uncharacterized protein n=1 Tax=Arabidopsis thaliana x Arabidopsis arenosa TaxID=1240361 RepID=A0A8T1Y8X7_9BRAS|nr:hypothetical protein ISN45_Aa07g019330 [Arabidopsis thaliana x Arabidopsis arenosa]